MSEKKRIYMEDECADKDACDLLHSEEGRADPTGDEHLPETNLVPGLDEPQKKTPRRTRPDERKKT